MDKLTDQEIEKALTICSSVDLTCLTCPAVFDFDDMNCFKVKKGALDIIKRLRAKNKELNETIQNLTIEKDRLIDKCEELKEVIERN